MSAGKGDWSRLAERGTMGALRIMVFVHRRLGRFASRFLLDLTVTYYPPESGAAA